MEDDQYATVLGTVIKHKAYQLGRFQKTEIEIEVDPVEMLELDPHSAAVLQGELNFWNVSHACTCTTHHRSLNPINL